MLMSGNCCIRSLTVLHGPPVFWLATLRLGTIATAPAPALPAAGVTAMGLLGGGGGGGD